MESIVYGFQVPHRSIAASTPNSDEGLLNNGEMILIVFLVQGMFAVIFFGSVDSPGRRKRLLQMAEAVMESGGLIIISHKHMHANLQSSGVIQH